VVTYDASVNMVLALVWVATGAVLVGVSAAVVGWRRAPGFTGRFLACSVSLGCFFLSSFWLVVPPVHAISTDIDSELPVDITCDSAWDALHGSPYVETGIGPVFSAAHGACQAAAWHRVASLGTAEVGLAVILGMASVLRRRAPESVRETDRSAI
jgi:hypothetical protein